MDCRLKTILAERFAKSCPGLADALEPVLNQVLTTGKPLLDIEVVG